VSAAHVSQASRVSPLNRGEKKCVTRLLLLCSLLDRLRHIQAKFFTESRLLQRPVRVIILSLPTSSATPFQTSANGSAPPPASIFIGTGQFYFNQYIILRTHIIIIVLHPAGNVAEHLVAGGLARVVDWHAGMLASGGGMERLRAAEKAAKEKRTCLYANMPAASPISGKANGTTTNGHTRNFDATVIRIWSGDQVSVVEKEGGKERRLQLSSTRGPRYAGIVDMLAIG
jgi:staphylococcal nuclease domain-containing protein 1